MVKINDTTTFPSTAAAEGDLCIGTDISNTTNSAGGETVNFSIASIRGVGSQQSWQSVTRTDGTAYQNTTGKPIMIMVVGSSATVGIDVSADGSVYVRASGGGGTITANVVHHAIVPNNHYYKYYNSLTDKKELR